MRRLATCQSCAVDYSHYLLLGSCQNSKEHGTTILGLGNRAEEHGSFFSGLETNMGGSQNHCALFGIA